MLKKISYFIFLAVSFFSITFCVFAQNDEESFSSSGTSKTIKAVEVQGNKAISTATIMVKIKTRPGESYYSQTARDDIKRLYETGYFSDISLNLEDFEGGIKVIFKVEERPVISKIDLEGIKMISRSALSRKMKSAVGQYLNYALLKEDIAAIKAEYERKGLPGVEVSYDTAIDAKDNKVKLVISVVESKRVKIKNIYVEGNLHFNDSKILGLIKTKRAGFFSAGFFKEEQFNEDLDRIKTFYLQNGYLDVSVDYRLDYDIEGDIYIRIFIDEGKVYTVGSITFQGDKKFSADELFPSLKACLVGGVFTYDALKEDVGNIQGFYFSKGYIFVQVRELTSLDVSSGKVDIVYSIVENELAYVDRIEIQGNLKTQDKVIRRELRIKPGEVFDGDKLKRSKERLYNLGFFEEVNYDTTAGSEPDRRNLVVEVKEAKTGSFSFGGGYSSIDQFVGFVEIEQKNFDWRNWKTFTGAGQDLKLRGEFGSVRQNFELSFTEPWLFDHPISFGFDGYKRSHDKDVDLGYGYEETRTGGDLRLGKEFNEYFKGGMTYRIEQVDISNVDDAATADLKSEAGKNVISSVEFSATWDTTDNIFNPTRGLVLSGSYELAGTFLGGDKDYNKVFGLASQYFPLPVRSVLQLQLRAGIAQPFGGCGKVPIYERFYAGGANTIRGYEERSVGPVDLPTSDPIGGQALLVMNVECTIPIVDFIKGAVFVDTGNVWAKASEFGTGGFKTGVGFGVRIKTPVGPLKLDYGIPLNKQPGKENKEGRFHFSMSHGF
ncbi:MAG: outer membrane protein assembly factor BamA [Candidatus Omnitrophota bacterium]